MWCAPTVGTPEVEWTRVGAAWTRRELSTPPGDSEPSAILLAATFLLALTLASQY